MPYTISKIFRVDVTEKHWLKSWEDSMILGKEHIDREKYSQKYNLHGHTLDIKVTLEGAAVDEAGYLIDTGVIEDVIAKEVYDLDRTLLVDKHDPHIKEIKEVADKGGIALKVMDCAPTFETLSAYIYYRCREKLIDVGLDRHVQMREVSIQGRLVCGSYYE